MRLLVFRVCLLLSAFVFSTAAVAAQEQLVQTTNIDSSALLLPDTPYSIAKYRVSSIFDQSDSIHYPETLSLYWIQTSTNPPKPAKPPVEKIKEDHDRPQHGGIHR